VLHTTNEHSNYKRNPCSAYCYQYSPFHTIRFMRSSMIYIWMHHLFQMKATQSWNKWCHGKNLLQILNELVRSKECALWSKRLKPVGTSSIQKESRICDILREKERCVDCKTLILVIFRHFVHSLNHCCYYCCNLSGGVALIVWFTTNGTTKLDHTSFAIGVVVLLVKWTTVSAL